MRYAYILWLKAFYLIVNDMQTLEIIVTSAQAFIFRQKQSNIVLSEKFNMKLLIQGLLWYANTRITWTSLLTQIFVSVPILLETIARKHSLFT